MSPTYIWLITILLLFLGVAGVVIPGLPGLALVFAGILFYAWMTNFVAVSTTTVAVIGIVALLAGLAEWYGSALAAGISGGRSKVIAGTIVGSIAGLVLLNAPGMLLGAFIGAFVGALAEGKDLATAGKVAAVSIVGLLGAKALQIVVALGIVVAFLIAVFF